MPQTERARKYMCAVCGGRVKAKPGQKLPPKEVACEQCTAQIKKQAREEVEREPPSKRFLVRFASSLSEQLPAAIVQQAMRQARGHAGGTGKVRIVEKSVLTTAERKKLPKTAFAIPEKAPGPGSYPIHDETHAHAALRYVARFGTPDEKARVRAAVRRKYPDIEVSKCEACEGYGVKVSKSQPDSTDVHVEGLLGDNDKEEVILCSFESPDDVPEAE